MSQPPRPRLDKQHGFLHHITRNQLDRRDYHHEKQQDTGVRDRRRDPRQSWQSRNLQDGTSKKEYMNKPDKDGIVFTLSVEYCPNKIAVLKVKKKDDPEKIARAFTDKHGMREDLTIALRHIISQKMGID